MIHRYHECCGGAGRAPFSLLGAGKNYERSLPFQYDHLELDLRVDLDEQMVDGSATWSIERRSPDATTLCLDAVAFSIRKVQLRTDADWVDVPFEYDSETLEVDVSMVKERAVLRVRYSARPKRGLYFLAPDERYPQRPKQAWSQCQDEDARHWFPCHDKPHVKVTTRVRVTVPNRFNALSNGVLEREHKNAKTGSKTFTYRMDQRLPSYLVTLVVGQFSKVEDRPAVLASGRRVPVEYWVPKGREADARRGFARTPDMIELFSRFTGVDYPYERYTQIVVSEFIFGGMENTTATTMYEHVLLDENATSDLESFDLVAHELAHQWFGDWVTCRDWAHAWLNEGFATYFEHVEREQRLDTDEYLAGVERDLATYLGESSSRYSRPVVSREYDAPIDLFDRHLYEKGGLILHLLRTELGDAAFGRGIRRYLNEHHEGNVTTDDLREALERESGRSLDRLFDEFVHRAGHPNLKARVEWHQNTLLVRFEQLQKPTYELSFEAIVVDAQGTEHRLLSVSAERHCSLSLVLDARPKHVVIDPELRLIGRTRMEVPTDMLKHQLQHASTARGRRQAAQLLAKKRDSQLPELLGRALNRKRESWSVRAACARSLAALRGTQAFSILERSSAVEDPRVRHAVVEALGRFPTPEALAALAALLPEEPSDLVRSAILRAIGQTRQPGADKLLKKQLGRPSWSNVVTASALTGLATLRDDKHLPVLMDHTNYGQPTRVRRSAVIALARHSESRKVREHLERLLDDPHPHLRSDVATALESLAHQGSRTALQRRLDVEDDGRVARRLRESLKTLEEGESKTELADRITRLEQQLGELMARLSVVEGKEKRESRKP